MACTHKYGGGTQKMLKCVPMECCLPTHVSTTCSNVMSSLLKQVNSQRNSTRNKMFYNGANWADRYRFSTHETHGE